MRLPAKRQSGQQGHQKVGTAIRMRQETKGIQWGSDAETASEFFEFSNKFTQINTFLIDTSDKMTIK
jgi:hypothetical protein